MAEEKDTIPEDTGDEEEPVASDGDSEALLAKAGASVTARHTEETPETLGEDEGQLMIDVYETPNEIILESPIAGVAPENIDIAITSESVTIRGKRERERHIREEDYVYQECYWGKFFRSVSLPREVDADNAEASIKNGVLTITLPKLNRSKSKKVKVKTG